MGYTHYWEKKEKIEKVLYAAIVNDFNKVLPDIEKHVKLAGPMGDGTAIIDAQKGEVRFNGVEKCGHQEFDLGIAWPSKGAGGVGKTDEAIDAPWFAGAKIETRCCSGCCAHESFTFNETDHPGREDKKTGLCFDFCKTAFKPYDLAVITFLIIAKHHLKDNLKVSSDGEDEHWFDGKMFCQQALGYGMEYAVIKCELKKCKVKAGG